MILSRTIVSIVAALCMTADMVNASAQEPSVATSDSLFDGFRDPPNAARPRVWWHWIGGNVSLDGAKLDLDWMQRVGVGGVHTFTGGGLPEPAVITPPVTFMSEEWKTVFRDTTRIARQAGMEVTIAGSPGWSETGGTWVPPEDAMKKYVWSETQLMGGKPFTGLLPQPPATTGPFLGVRAVRRGAPPQELRQDVYGDSVVIAFPTPRAEIAVGAPRITSSAGAIDLSPLAGNLANAVTLPLVPEQDDAWVQAAFDKPTTLAALQLGLGGEAIVEIQVSDDGLSFRRVGPIEESADRGTHVFQRHEYALAPQQTYAFAPTTGRFFRVVLTAPPPAGPLLGLPPQFSHALAPSRVFTLTRLNWCGGGRENRFESKAGFQSSIEAGTASTPAAAVDAVIPVGKVLDLTALFRADGRLRWTPPSGHWTVLRFGWSLTGQTNGPADAGDTGLEVDKLDAGLVRAYIEHYLGLYREAVGADLGAANIQNLLTDSWEAGAQNWTPTLLAQFKARRGYDPLPYLPCLAGRVVGDSALSERFLWDFYRTLKEILADNHYGVLAQVLHEHGMGYYTEAEGDTPRAIADGMTVKAHADIPTAEFWYRQFASTDGQASLKADLKEAASAAHVYGKPLAAAESLTVAAGRDPWAFSPAMLKPVVDEIFAYGINRILVHESHHQPLIDAKPGLELFFIGQFFNRNDTWAEEAGSWVSYLSRTSYLLQQGGYVADVAYFYGEDRNLTELYTDHDNTDVPSGYAYDYINPESLLTRLTVADGRIITPGGMSYRVLYIPGYVKRMTLQVIQKLRELVGAGAMLVGEKPIGGYGLKSPDSAVLAVADELWGAEENVSATNPPIKRELGKGQVYRTTDLGAALEADAIAPDVRIDGAEPDVFMTLHRRTADSDIYFISNRRDHPEQVEMTFRVGHEVPEVWHAEDGSREPATYRLTDQGVRVSLSVGAQAAEFVVLRGQPKAPAWTAPAWNVHVLADLQGPWTVHFQPGRGAPGSATFAQLVDWADSLDPRVKYFSGAATYAKSLVVPASWAAHGQRLVLDLGDVRELAVVSVDGQVVATRWHPPYQVDLTDVLPPGKHRLDIKVVNLWVNRLIGDKQSGVTPIAFAPQSPYQADSTLRSSGLLGPVRILGH
jgi:hypothetical protein